MGKNIHSKPKYSIICLIYKSNEWLDFVYNQVIKYTNLDEVEFFFIANNASEEVKQYLKDNYIPHYNYESSEEQKSEWYINNVYRGYNFGAEKAQGEHLIFINSDMAFSKDWLENLVSKYNGSNCVASRLIESGRFFTGKYGLEKDFGTEFFNYKEEEFLDFAEQYKEKSVSKEGGLYMPLLINRQHFFDIGQYPEGNLKKGSDLYKPTISLQDEERSYTGDEALVEKLKRKGIQHVTAFDSIVYHFQAGELSYDKLSSTNNKINIAIYNDIVTGSMGEKVLWDYLIEKLPGNVYGVDSRCIDTKGNLASQANKYLDERHPNTDIIIQNATFITKMPNEIPTIAYLQDDLKKMGQDTLLQAENLEKVDLIVTNSIYTQDSYIEFPSELIPIGLNQDLFKPGNKKQLRIKYSIPEGFIGIFVGSLNQTKGWNEIKKEIQTNNDVDYWIIVSKYEEEFNFPNTSFYTRLSQESLVELLNCADFFILGSKVETQCLAALEAGLCELPVVMRNIGIFKEFSTEDKKKLGEFGSNFGDGIKKIKYNKLMYSPRSVLLLKGLDIDSMIDKWFHLISRFLMISKRKKFIGYKKKKIEKTISTTIEVFLRKTILSKLGLGSLNINNLKKITFYKQAIYTIYKKILGR